MSSSKFKNVHATISTRGLKDPALIPSTVLVRRPRDVAAAWVQFGCFDDAWAFFSGASFAYKKYRGL
jgi:hypothetical protein